MLEQIKDWIERRRAGSTGGHDREHLPTPKTAGDQRLSDCRLIVLDLETTGLNPAKDNVIAIARWPSGTTPLTWVTSLI